MNFEIFIYHQKELIGANKLRQVIEDLKTVYRNENSIFDILILFDSQYNRFLENKAKGILSIQEEDLTLNKLNNGVLDFIDNLSQNKRIYYELPHLFLETDSPYISVDERVLWNYIDGASSIEGYKLYLKKYPKGLYTSKAKFILDTNVSNKYSNPELEGVSIIILKNPKNLIEARFFLTKFYDDESLFNEFEKTIQVYNRKITKENYGTSWILRDLIKNKFLQEKKTITRDSLNSKYEIVVFKNNYIKLSTGEIIKKSRLNYELKIREEALEYLSDSDLSDKLHEEILEIKTKKNKHSVKEGSIDKKLSIQEIFLRFILFPSLYFLFAFIYTFYVFLSHDLDFNFYGQSKIRYSILLLPITIFFVYNWIFTLRYFDNKNKFIVTNISALFFSLISMMVCFNSIFDFSNKKADFLQALFIMFGGILIYGITYLFIGILYSKLKKE